MYMCVLIIVLIIVVSLFVIVRYNEEGESNMPFNISKISVISSQEAEDIKTEESQNTRQYSINQTNDIYIYIEKNEDYDTTETIESIEISNFVIEANGNEDVYIYKPSNLENIKTLNSLEENIVDNIIFTSGLSDATYADLEISNQGGLIAFRCTNNNVTTLTSDDEELNHLELLKKSEITNDDLEIMLSFDISILLDKQVEFNSTITINLPAGDVIEEGTSSIENILSENIIFKRIYK